MSESIFLAGDRVSLTTVEDADLPFRRDLLNDPRVRRTIYEHLPRTLHQHREWWEGLDPTREVHLLIHPTGADDPVGTASLSGIDAKSGLGGLGYVVAPEAWGNGYATAAVELLTAYGFDERRLAKLWAAVYAHNEASARVLGKAGFEHEAVHRKEAFVDGTRVDVHYYGLLREEWSAPPRESETDR